jgi:DNA-binding NarL/FixJ family response regulator
MIVDDHAVVRRGVRAYLEALDDMAVAAEAADGQEALDQLAKMAAHGSLPDVVLLDLVMPRMDGVLAASLITSRHPAVRVVILTSFGEMERVHAALAGGAVGYLLKDAGPAEVATAIHAAAGDGTYLDPAIARRLTREISAPRSGLNALTGRERAVLVLVAHGRSNKEIADELVISERTARTHVSHVLRKLQLTSRTQAALVAVREGLVPPETAPSPRDKRQLAERVPGYPGPGPFPVSAVCPAGVPPAPAGGAA